MSLVFVSYSRNDQSAVLDVARVIREGGFDVWLDVERINSETDLDTQIYDALQAAKYIVACVFGEMGKRPTGYVFLEYDTFRKRLLQSRKSIILLR